MELHHKRVKAVQCAKYMTKYRVQLIDTMTCEQLDLATTDAANAINKYASTTKCKHDNSKDVPDEQSRGRGGRWTSGRQRKGDGKGKGGKGKGGGLPLDLRNNPSCPHATHAQSCRCCQWLAADRWG